MKKFFSMMVILLSIHSSSWGQDTEQTVSQEKLNVWVIESTAQAKRYTDLLDRGRYAEAYRENSEVNKIIMRGMKSPEDEWVRALNLKRKPFGRALSRTILDVRVAQDPPGATKGDYMIVQYNTKFEKGTFMEEIVMRHEGNKWRILDYKIKAR